MKRENHFPVLRLPLWGTLLTAVLLSGGVTLLALWCQPNALRSVLAVFRGQPLLIILNALPVGLLLLAFTCLFRNVFFGAALTECLVCALSIANRIKIEVRDEPVFPRDLSLIKEVGSVLGSYDIPYPTAVIAIVFLSVTGLVVLGCFIRLRPLPVKKLRGWPGRLLGTLGCAAALIALLLTVYASNGLYQSFRTTNPYYVPGVFNELGFPYGFCHHLTAYTVDKPEGFRLSDAAGWESEAVETGDAGDVHVIVVMNEAFSDITDNPAFTYTAENDPLANLHALRDDPHAVSGHIVVPGFAAGTANTEFDVLTGMQTNALSAATTSALRAVNGNVGSLFRVFSADGYRTSFFHPGDDWFYNRENVFHWFGAEKTVFIDQMTDPVCKGRWVTDDYMAGEIEAEFESAAADGVRLFHNTTTIQNHMAYTADKYGAGYTSLPVETALPLSDAAAELLSVYIDGARDADAMLGRLRDYFAASEEPVVLVFYGDHLPFLGDNQLVYEELGFTKQAHWTEIVSHETPFVIWANDTAAETLDWENAVSAADIPDTLSACFLGSVLVELTGRNGENSWFHFLNQLRREAPVVCKQSVVLADGTVSAADALPDTLAAQILKWRQWSYYRLKCMDVE